MRPPCQVRAPQSSRIPGPCWRSSQDRKLGERRRIGGPESLDSDGQDEQGQPLLVETALDSEHSVVVEEAGHEGVALEDQLPAEEDRVRKAQQYFRCQIRRLGHHVDAHRRGRLARETALTHIVHVTRIALLDVLLKVLDLRRALEVARIHDTYLYEKEVLKHAREQPDDGEERVQAETIEAVDEHNRRLGFGVQRRALRRL